MRTISIDNEVYEWLQQNAKPFEDSPNSVLRRVAGIQESPVAPTTSSVTTSDLPKPSPYGLTAAQLNEEWGVRAKHALYHKDGLWYGNLRDFPGAYFDPMGYILFKSEDAYRSCPDIKIGIRTNLKRHISQLPAYQKMR